MVEQNGSAFHGAMAAIANRVETKAMQTLMGMVTGIVSDEVLHDREIQLLSTWLLENQACAAQWPGSAIAAQVRAVLADGIVTEEERSHLLTVLRDLANSDFSASGSAVPEPIRLPVDDSAVVSMMNAGVVHTGTFLFGTRSACERLSMAMGGMPLDNVTKHTDVLVIGTRVTPAWVNESYGRKILRGAELREAGHPIRIISEAYWFRLAQDLGKT